MNKCCVCLEHFKNNNKNIYRCNTCKDTIVCNNCYNFMRESNIHNNCPVCRSEHWMNKSIIIVIDNSVNLHIDINNEEPRIYNTPNIIVYIDTYLARLKQLCKCLCKLLICLLIIWSFGFILTSMYNQYIYQYIHYPEVIFMIFIVGFSSSCFIYYLYNKCKENND